VPHILHDKAAKLFLLLGGFFIANVIIAEIIGVKIFQLETTLGFAKLDYNIFGVPHLSLSYTCGVILWPVVFIMTDIINEYYGRRGVRFLSLLAASLIVFAFFAFYIAIHTTPVDWWIEVNKKQGVPDMNKAYASIIGQGNNIIVGSLIAFIIGQLIDIYIFTIIKKNTGEKWIGIRAFVSTALSQLVDSFVVIYIAFYFAGNWPLHQANAVSINNYLYKLLMALALTPILYLMHLGIEKYLGKEVSRQLKEIALINK